jgi:deazaflavin-dependent oxidoreductase (nitroreductase family)
MAYQLATNAAVIAHFRANGGQVPAPYDNPPPMVLLHTIGARSGREHIVPMRAMVDGESLYIFASAHGSPRHPDWYYNLRAHPEAVAVKDDLAAGKLGRDPAEQRRPVRRGQVLHQTLGDDEHWSVAGIAPSQEVQDGRDGIRREEAAALLAVWAWSFGPPHKNGE